MLTGLGNIEIQNTQQKYISERLFTLCAEQIREHYSLISQKLRSGINLPQYEQNYFRAVEWVWQMDDSTFANDFVSVMMFLNAGFRRLPNKHLYYDEVPEISGCRNAWAWIGLDATSPETTIIYNCKNKGLTYEKYFWYFEHWHVYPFSILHELCHMIARFTDPTEKASSKFKPSKDDLPIWKHVSDYAAEFSCEYCAEALVYLFTGRKDMHRKYLKDLPPVGGNMGFFDDAYTNLVHNGYKSLYDDHSKNLIRPIDLAINFDIAKQSENWNSLLNKCSDTLRWAAANYHGNAAANMITTYLCWYLNNVYDRMPCESIEQLELRLINSRK